MSRRIDELLAIAKALFERGYSMSPIPDITTTISVPTLITQSKNCAVGKMKALPVDGDPYNYANISTNFWTLDDLRDTYEFVADFQAGDSGIGSSNWNDAVIDRMIDTAKEMIKKYKYMSTSGNYVVEVRGALHTGWYDRGGVCDWWLGYNPPDCRNELPIVHWAETCAGNTCATGATGSADYRYWNGIDDKFGCVQQAIVDSIASRTWEDLTSAPLLSVSSSRRVSASRSYVGGSALGEYSDCSGVIEMSKVRLTNFNYRAGKLYVYAYTPDDVTDPSFTDLRGMAETNKLKLITSIDFAKNVSGPTYFDLDTYSLVPDSPSQPNGWVDDWWVEGMNWSASESSAKQAVSLSYQVYCEPTWEANV